MGVSTNKAYEGQFTNNGCSVLVFYADATTLAHWNRGRSRVHPDNWKAGWYWTTLPDTRYPGVGPFTSSRLAYKDATALCAPVAA